MNKLNMKELREHWNNSSAEDIALYMAKHQNELEDKDINVEQELQDLNIVTREQAMKHLESIGETLESGCISPYALELLNDGKDTFVKIKGRMITNISRPMLWEMYTDIRHSFE